MRLSIAIGMLSFLAVAALAAESVRSIPVPPVALERPADALGTTDGRLDWRARWSPAEDRERLVARLDRGPDVPLALEGLDGLALPAVPLSPGLHFVELSLERRGGRITTITDEVLAGPFQADEPRGCDLSLTLTPQGLRDLLVPVVEAKLLAGARDNDYFGKTTYLARKELEVVDGGLRFSVKLDTTEEGKGDLEVAGVVDVMGDGGSGVVAKLRRIETAKPGPKLEALARAEGGRRLRGVGAVAGERLVKAAGGGSWLGFAGSLGGAYLGSKVGEEVGERVVRDEVPRQARAQIERALAVATDALRLPDDVVVLPTDPALRADLRWCDAAGHGSRAGPTLTAAMGLQARLRLELHGDEASEQAAARTVLLRAAVPEPRSPSQAEANVHVDVSADLVNRLLAEWVVRGGLQASLDASGLQQEVQDVLGDRTRWQVRALRAELPPLVWPHADGHIDATVGGVILELDDPERGKTRSVVLGGHGAVWLQPEPEPGRLRLAADLDEVYLGCRERSRDDGLELERRLPCFAAVLDPEVLREQLDAQLRARSDRLPVLDLGAMLELQAFGAGEVKTLELVDTWVTAEDGILAIDAQVR
jgi:hypothetical protein